MPQFTADAILSTLLILNNLEARSTMVNTPPLCPLPCFYLFDKPLVAFQERFFSFFSFPSSKVRLGIDTFEA